MDGSIPLTELSPHQNNSHNHKKHKHRQSDLEAQVRFLSMKRYFCYTFNSQDPGSMLSGVSKDSFEEERGVTCTDIKLIMPTVLILLFTLFIMVTVIPYAFSSVIKQLQAVWALEDQCESKSDLHLTLTGTRQ